MVDANSRYSSDQENFWAGEFGQGYMARNNDEALIAASTWRFSKILSCAPGVHSIVEFGCNIGLNLSALQRINPKFDLHAYEINENAAAQARDRTGANVINATIAEKFNSDKQFDLAFTSGVLIHINPDLLSNVYDNLYNISRKYICVCEYYNPTPVSVNYRGHKDRLFKRDFAGDLIERFGLRLINYGFEYKRDNYFPQDDVTWFLLEKIS